MVKNQAYLRYRNKKSILNLLRVHPQSYSDLARTLKLSNTAIAKIADDLIGDAIVFRMDESKGRQGIKLCIDSNYGYIIALDLSSVRCTMLAMDLAGKVLLREELGEIVNFTRTDLDRLVESVANTRNNPVLQNRKLTCFCVATPGKIDKNTGRFILNPRFFGSENVSLKDLFGEVLDCPVLVKNDINLALEGEKYFGGTLANCENALMLHIDVGMGAAFLINGKVYEGSHGFAGEIGYFLVNMSLTSEDSFQNLSYANYYDSYSLFSMLSVLRAELQRGKSSVIREWCEEQGIDVQEVPFSMMIQAYLQEDFLTCRIVDSAAQVIGNVARNLAELLDVDVVLLNGTVGEMGDSFLRVVSKNMGGVPVRYPDLMEDATVMGAANAAIDESFHQILSMGIEEA